MTFTYSILSPPYLILEPFSLLIALIVDHLLWAWHCSEHWVITDEQTYIVSGPLGSYNLVGRSNGKQVSKQMSTYKL